MRKYLRLIIWFAAIPFVYCSVHAGLNSDVSKKTAVVSAGKQYEASGFFSFVLGRNYRELWTAPVEVEILDLKSFAGGLSPLGRLESNHVQGILFEGQNGIRYTFRTLDRDPAAFLPSSLAQTLSPGLIQDQITAVHPAGILCVVPILEAAGILHPEYKLVVLPDDPYLGEFRKDFSGMVGTISEYPQAVSASNPGFSGAEEIISTYEMWNLLHSDTTCRIDALAFLRTRLVDLLIGEWNRHPGRWRWVRMPEGKKWKPLPEIQDQAFADYRSLLISFARQFNPQLVRFKKKSPLEGLIWEGRSLDRYFLNGIGNAEWMAVAQDVQSQITDSVIEQAVRRLPEAYYNISGKRLEDLLKIRRDRLLNTARRYYLYLAGKVDIHGSGRADDVEIWRLAKGEVLIRMSLTGEGESPYFERRFRPVETKEIRIYLFGGDDHAVVNGPSSGRIKIRVIGGEGEDRFDDPRRGSVKFYDASETTILGRGTRTQVDSRPYVTKEKDEEKPWELSKDWGERTVPTQWIGGSSDYGIFLGAGVRFRKFGFRKYPFAVSHRLRIGYAEGANRAKAVYEGDFRWGNSSFYNTLLAEASGLEILNFYGFGNASAAGREDGYNRIHQSRYRLFAPFCYGLTDEITLFLGPDLSYSNIDESGEKIISDVQPYGAGSFGQIGIRMGLSFDTREHGSVSRTGFRINAQGAFHPAVFSVKTQYATVEGNAVFSYRITSPFWLAVRLGGKKNFGSYPFQDAAFIGGADTVRGFHMNRFAGDACLYGNAELRMNLGRAFLFLPGEYGVFVLTDVGRIFLESDDSSLWHKSAGGGVYFSVVDQTTVFSLAVAKSRESTSVYFKAGFSF